MKIITAELAVADGKRSRDGRRITPAARRAELVAGYRSSGLTMALFAQREGLNRHTLAKWVFLSDQADRAGRGSGDSGRPQFAELRVAAPARWAFELTLPNGWVVRAADAAAVTALLAAAEG